MAEIYLTMSREINKLYFADLAGAAAGTLILDPLLQQLSAESVALNFFIDYWSFPDCSFDIIHFIKQSKDCTIKSTSN